MGPTGIRTEDRPTQSALVSSGFSPTLKLAEGENYIRILPPHKNMVNPETGKPSFYFPVALHRNVGPNKRRVPCPRRNFGQPCPICEKAFDLKGHGYEESAKSLYSNYVMLMNAVLFDKGGEPIRKGGNIVTGVWAPSREKLDELMDLIAERETEKGKPVDISDPEGGFLVKVKRTGTGQTSKYKVMSIASRPTDIMPLVETWDAELRDLSVLYPAVPAEDMALMLTGADEKDPMAPRADVKAIASPFDDDEETVDGEFSEVPEAAVFNQHGVVDGVDAERVRILRGPASGAQASHNTRYRRSRGMRIRRWN